MAHPGDIVTTDGVVAQMSHAKWEAIKAHIATLERALDLCMVCGNHLPLIFGVDHPHTGIPSDVALHHFGPGDKYEAWCCWDAIMRARDIRDNA